MDNYPYFENSIISRPEADGGISLKRIIHNVALQAPCFDCHMQVPYIDKNGIIRCERYQKCNKVIHYAKAEHQYVDPDFDDIHYARCGNCGITLARPDDMTKCPCCGYEIIWEKDEPL